MHLTRSALAALLALVLLSFSALADESRLTVRTAAGVDHMFTVELADTPDEQSRGLMFRESLAPDAGMLFDFHVSRPTSFWMQNTLIPLDMLFIDAKGKIVHIHENAVPQSLEPIPSQHPASAVIELNGGRAKAEGIAPGDTVSHLYFQ